MRETTLKREPEAALSPVIMAHIFKSELSRSDTWRTRLDTTTNWALTTTAAVVSFGFSTGGSHITFLGGLWMVVSFLMIEARRYRYYDLWNRRLRLLEEGYWAPLFRHEPTDPDAIRELAHEMERPQIQLSLFSAVATRLNRTYGPILIVLLLSWFVKVYSQPTPVTGFREFVERTHVGPLPGMVVCGILALVTVVFAVMIVAARVVRAPLGELRTRPRNRSFSWMGAFQPYARTEPRRRGRGASGKAGAPPTGSVAAVDGMGNSRVGVETFPTPRHKQ